MRALRFFIAFGLVLSAQTAAGQTKVALVHGINSDSTTWSSLRSELISPDGFTVPTPRSFTWNTYIATQVSSQLLPFLNSNGLGNSSLLAGHSQGGLLARFASESLAVKATLTVGTPNVGAPAASSWARTNFLTYTSSLFAHDYNLFVAFSDVRSTGSSHYLHTAVGSLDSWGFLAFYAVLDGLSAALYMIDYNNTLPPNFADMTPAGWSGASGFISSLNSNFANEQATYKVAIRMGLGAYGGYWGGPIRLFESAYDADVAGNAIMGLGYSVYLAGINILNTLDVSDYYYYEHQAGAYSAIALGNAIGYFPYLWHDDIVGGVPNDGLIAVADQYVTGQETDDQEGYAHTEETNIGRGTVRTWLNTLRSR